MLNIIVITTVFLAVAECAPVDTAWEVWKKANGKVFNSAAEEANRHAIFNRNQEIVNTHNSKHSLYKMAVNKLADMKDGEIALRLGAKVPVVEGSKTTKATTTKSTTTTTRATTTTTTTQPSVATLDWRTSGAVTPIKDQGQCGSCWSFSATGALESRYKIKYGTLVSLSEQNLMDCSYSYGNNACNGGWMNSAFNYVRDVAGINTEVAYPYKSVSSTTCLFNNSANARYAALTSTPYYSVPVNNEAALIQALQTGPVAIAFQVTSNFNYYSSGIFSDPTCTTSINHGMLLVGYGTDPASGTNYWIVKNSWGTWWGEQGYIRIARGSNMCGILSYPSYPIIV